MDLPEEELGPVVDVVIPTCNARPVWLEAAVSSALSCPSVGRVIVVDDGSDPPAGLSAPVDRVEVLPQPNQGPSAARNRGIGQTTAGWVLFLDADDEALPSGVEAMLRLGARHGAVAVVAARMEEGPDGGGRVRPPPVEWVGRTIPDPTDVFRPIALFGASGCLVHRRVLDAGVRFDVDLRIGEDRDFLRRAVELGPIAVCGEPATRVRIHSGGTNLTSPAHMERRVRDHLVLLERWGGGAADRHLRAATVWLVNAAAKAGVDAQSWGSLVAACRARGWPIPLKARFRRLTARGS